jgi:hypothetical protein
MSHVTQATLVGYRVYASEIGQGYTCDVAIALEPSTEMLLCESHQLGTFDHLTSQIMAHMDTVAVLCYSQH